MGLECHFFHRIEVKVCGSSLTGTDGPVKWLTQNCENARRFWGDLNAADGPPPDVVTATCGRPIRRRQKNDNLLSPTSRQGQGNRQEQRDLMTGTGVSPPQNHLLAIIPHRLLRLFLSKSLQDVPSTWKNWNKQSNVKGGLFTLRTATSCKQTIEENNKN